MKTKVKRMSKRTLALLLGVLMLVTSIGVGSIITVYADTYYLWYGTNNSISNSSAYSCAGAMTSIGNNQYKASFTNSEYGNFAVFVNTSNSSKTSGLDTNISKDNTTSDGNFNDPFNQGFYEGNTNITAVATSKKTSATTMYVVYNSSTHSLYFSTSDPGSGSGDDTPSGDSGTKVSDNDLIAVLKRTKIMIYFGDKWDSGTKYVKKGTTTTNETSGTSEKLTIDNSDCHVANGYIPTGAKYSISNNNSWAGMSINSGNNMTTSQAGYLYYMYNDGANQLIEKTSNASVTWSTNSDTITAGNSTSSIKATVSGKTGAGRSVSVKYFYTSDDTNFYSFDPSSVSGLSEGTYTIYAAAYDTKIYVAAASTATLTVNAPESKHDVTFSVNDSNMGSISPNTTTAVGESTATTVTATANTGYKFSSWTNGTGINQATNTENGDNQTQTITTKSSGEYTVEANFTKKNLTVTVNQPASGGTIASDKSTAQIGDTVTITATPNTGYSLSSITYSYNGTSGTASGTGNTRAFTMPGYNTTVTAIFAKTNYTIVKTVNPTGAGTVTVKKTNSSGAEVSQYNIGDTLYLTASPEAAYTFTNFTVTYGDGTTETKENNTTIDMTGKTGNITVQGNFTAKPTYNITTKTNSGSLGTVSVNTASAYEGQSVTVTINELDGTLTNWKVVKADDSTTEVVSARTTKEESFTMPAYAVRVIATFETYSGESNYYYNSYETSGSPSSTRYGVPMTEAKLGGETYSYYHVTGRSGANQLFTVSYQSPVYNNYYTFFSIYSSWENGGVSAQFYATDGNNLGDYANMTFDGFDSTDKKKFRIEIPDGARTVRFKNNNGGATTNELSLASGNNAWYVSGDNLTTLTAYSQSNPVPINFWENFNSGKYTNAFSTGGFGNYNANRGASHSYSKPNNMDESQYGDYYILALYKGKTYTINGETITIGNDPEIIWLPELPSTPSDDDEVTYVDLYAKNGMLRDSTFNRFTNLAKTKVTKVVYPDGTIVNEGGAIEAYGSKTMTWNNNVTGYSSNYVKMTNVPVGSTITLETELSPGGETYTGTKKFSDTHYLKAYSMNGKSYKLHTASEGTATENGVKYTEEWVVESINTDHMGAENNGHVVEINPIYYLKDNTNTKTFYIEGYEGELQENWGTTLAVYPYYEGKSNAANAFGGYPGQPMLFYGGKYQMEIPLTVDGTSTGAQVKGLTLHNAYWDLLHRSLDKKCDDNHRQTYDYDDFYKLYKEKTTDSIIFWFKYRTQNDNYGDGYDYTNYEFAKKGVAGNESNSTSTTIAKVQAANGAEIVTDYYGRQVDAFGTLITNASDKTSYSGQGTTGMNGKELLFVSTGYKDTYVGEYATLWAVYKQDSTKGNFTLLGYISSSMLYLNNFDNVSKYSDGTNTASGRMSWDVFEDTYTTLKDDYQGVPVLISYDKEIWNDSKDKAFRSDGKWFYSTGNEKIEANVKIQYVNDATAPAIDSDAWTDDAYDSTKTGTGGEKNIGTTTGCSAYFTNTSPEYLLGKTESGKIFVDNDEYFTFEAKSAGMWEFVGWVRYSGGHYYEISSTNGVGQSNISSNDTYIARFKQASKGTLVVSHNIEKNSQYKGDGTKYLKVRVLNGTTPVFTEENTDGSDINVSKFINSKNSAYKIEITATTVGDEDCTPVERLADPSYYALKGNVSGNTLTQTETFTVADVLEGDNATSAIRYITHLTKTNYNYTYEIQYNYTSRLWGDQSYTVTGNIDELQADKYFSGAKSSARLLDSFIKSSTPYEKNFRQTINWNYSNATKGATVNGTNVKLTATVNSTNTVNDKVTAEFILPYKYNEDTVENGEVTEYGDKKGVKLDVYDGDNKVGEDYAYDDKSYTSFTLTSKTGSLFEYDNPATPNAVTPSSTTDDFKLVEAAPYVIKNPEFTYSKSSTKRYYTGNSFKVNGTTYYLREKPEGAEGTVITDAEVANGKYTVTIRKPGKDHDTTYKYAVQDNTTGEVYFFAYALGTVDGEEDVPVDNDGNKVTNPEDYVFNGQYIVYSETNNISGIKQKDSYEKKYFTRWDIYTTSGKYVTSSFYQRFNYSGYEDYIVYPIYESDSVSASPATFDGESKDADIATSVGLLDTSRNQWNNSGKGTYPGDDGSTDADKIFADFALSFYNKGEQISTSDENVKIGMVIEILGKVEKADGTAVLHLKEDDAVTDSSYYAKKYNTGETFVYDADKVKSYVEAKVKNTTVPKLPCNGSWFLPISNIDNFNRLQYTYTFTQGTNGNLKTQGQYVYRATSYICVKENGTWTTKTSSPEYFVLYDIASR